MTLTTGTRIGVYQVTGMLGAGGMGEVYRARDTKLDRDVALKVLPEAFTSDPERLARFEREAKVLASLNHPNIGGIHGFEDSGDVRALVLELIEGPTLADRIGQGPIPIDEALPIATQIAEALEAAHEAGVIHRDLKPANIKVRPDGVVKVLDFGLAKAFQPDESADPNMSVSPTISLTAAATQIGMVIGTAAYMAPEQASGRPIDKRADIWAFGAVLYEMLTGTRPFAGDDVAGHRPRPGLGCAAGRAVTGAGLVSPWMPREGTAAAGAEHRRRAAGDGRRVRPRGGPRRRGGEAASSVAAARAALVVDRFERRVLHPSLRRYMGQLVAQTLPDQYLGSCGTVFLSSAVVRICKQTSPNRDSSTKPMRADVAPRCGSGLPGKPRPPASVAI